MSTQDFHSPVGQVAGRDIINEASQMLWDCETAELQIEYKRCRSKLWRAKRDLYMNVPFFWSLLGLASAVWLLFSGTILKFTSESWFFPWLIGALVVPGIWHGSIKKKKAKMIGYYHERIEIIDLILQDRA